MRVMTGAELRAALPYPRLIDALDDAFREGCSAPLRQHHAVGTDASAGTLLLMPAWQAGRHIGIKTVTIFPGNAARGLASVQGLYTLLDGPTGAPLALLDGPVLTTRRTAAASALAARYLARPDAARLLMVGTGALAPELVRAHAAARPIREVRIWGRDPAKAAALAGTLAAEGIAAAPAADLAAAVAWADLVSCATLSSTALVRGEWLSPGCHLDLVGAFLPTMREADDEAVRRARVFVDTRTGGLNEAGDIVQAIAAGALTAEAIQGELAELAAGTVQGRRTPAEITLFKSVGTALEDLAAARLAVAPS